ncbi:hypothetical protein [Parablautia intestinalis]|jgi:hypothetical protein|uniref:hypothetical protein n=1 Tax=Parablautia intestinalis TaxID=2320100 RepID=UPI0023D77FA5|nr:hypothetical protein [Parablautia intestinalis]MCI8613571.1 hypothetical protein [Lachnospiraceae bacterium]MDE7047177.1 hypothetical protein [Lachnospiraceae bacterium]
MSQKEKKPRVYHGVRDEIRQQHMKAKDMTLKERLAYFWYYYKVHTLVFICAVFALVAFVRDIAASKDYIFNGLMLNSYGLPSDELSMAFADYADLDLETYDCFIDTSTTLSLRSMGQYDAVTVQKIIATIQTGDLDAVVYDSEIFNNYSEHEMFMDLRTAFTQEELEQYKDYLYYIDYAEVLKLQEAKDDYTPEVLSDYQPSEEELDAALAEETRLHRHPENMENPIPVGVILEDSAFAQKTGAYPQKVPVFGIIHTSHRLDVSKKYLEFLWDETIDFAGIVSSGQVY